MSSRSMFFKEVDDVVPMYSDKIQVFAYRMDASSDSAKRAAIIWPPTDGRSDEEQQAKKRRLEVDGDLIIPPPPFYSQLPAGRISTCRNANLLARPSLRLESRKKPNACWEVVMGALAYHFDVPLQSRTPYVSPEFRLFRFMFTLRLELDHESWLVATLSCKPKMDPTWFFDGDFEIVLGDSFDDTDELMRREAGVRLAANKCAWGPHRLMRWEELRRRPHFDGTTLIGHVMITVNQTCEFAGHGMLRVYTPAAEANKHYKVLRVTTTESGGVRRDYTRFTKKVAWIESETIATQTDAALAPAPDARNVKTESGVLSVSDDSLVEMVHVPTFGDDGDTSQMVTLCAEGQKMRVRRNSLFEKLKLFREINDVMEIRSSADVVLELKDVDYARFLSFVALTFSDSCGLADETEYEPMMELSKRFKNDIAKEKCVRFLLDRADSVDAGLLLSIGEQLGMDNVVQRALDCLDTVPKVFDVINGEHYKKLSKELSMRVLRRIKDIDDV